MSAVKADGLRSPGTRNNLPLSLRHQQRDYSPLSWLDYFDEAHDLRLESGDSFRVYLKNFREPFAPDRPAGKRLNPENLDLSSSQLTQYTKVPTLVAIHGGGYSALTWAQFTRHLTLYCKCRVLAIDSRAHGDSKTSNDARMDADTLVSDLVGVTREIHYQICGFLELPKLILVGHSMGGAIAIKCAADAELLPTLAGIVVIDVVEGTAKDALPLMLSVIKTRPLRFPSLANAIEWSFRSGMTKNLESARVSMPGNLVNLTNHQLAIHEVLTDESEKQHLKESLTRHQFNITIGQLLPDSRGFTLIQGRPPFLPTTNRVIALKTEDSGPVFTARATQIQSSEDIAESPGPARNSKINVEQDDNFQRPPEVGGYAWRTNLADTQPHWAGWFEGLSNQFLDAPIQGKFLLLAGIDRLDRALTIGQMQGKFMMKVLPKCGHAVHEDLPEQVAQVIGEFLVRNKFTEAYDL